MGIKTGLDNDLLRYIRPLKNLPTTWGLRLFLTLLVCNRQQPLKNLPTTWGLRLSEPPLKCIISSTSEKPPHHMGIKTVQVPPLFHMASNL